MEHLSISIEGKANADLLIRLLGKFNFVKSVIREKTSKSLSGKANIVTQSEYNWINPTRPATDEEFEKMISEAEAEKSITAKEARELTSKKINEWKKLNLV